MFASGATLRRPLDRDTSQSVATGRTYHESRAI